MIQIRFVTFDTGAGWREGGGGAAPLK